MTRRDKCFKVGEKAMRLNNEQAKDAWYSLAAELIELGERDVPKFRDVLYAVIFATMTGRRISRQTKSN